MLSFCEVSSDFIVDDMGVRTNMRCHQWLLLGSDYSIGKPVGQVPLTASRRANSDFVWQQWVVGSPLTAAIRLPHSTPLRSMNAGCKGCEANVAPFF